MNDVAALVLAAGKGTRMYSDLAKVLHPICGRPMLSYTLAALQEMGLSRILVVVGHQAERIKSVHADTEVEWVLQAEQLGTAHAVQCALPHLSGFAGSVLICCGDTPLLTADTLRMFLGEHMNCNADLSVLSMVLKKPGNYGRVIRNAQGAVLGIIEAKDASERERHIREVNTGIYCAKAFSACVTGLDADAAVFPYLHLHAQLNAVNLQTRQLSFEHIQPQDLSPFDLIVGADICFWDELVDPLYHLIRQGIKAGVSEIFLADPDRPPFDDLCARFETACNADVLYWETDTPFSTSGRILRIIGDTRAPRQRPPGVIL